MMTVGPQKICNRCGRNKPIREFHRDAEGNAVVIDNKKNAWFIEETEAALYRIRWMQNQLGDIIDD